MKCERNNISKQLPGPQVPVVDEARARYAHHTAHALLKALRLMEYASPWRWGGGRMRSLAGGSQRRICTPCSSSPGSHTMWQHAGGVM